MTKIVGTHFRIRGKNDGSSRITFYGENGEEVEINYPTKALLALSQEFRRVAHILPIPISKRSASGGRRSLSGPTLPPLDDTSENGPAGSMFGIGVTADFELIEAWFNFHQKAGEPGTRLDIGLSIADAEKLVADLSKAILIAKTSAENQTQH